jgi:C_GCAxxG_C_C family probable redox protein
MSAKSDVAEARFLSGYNCAQSIVYAFSDALQIDKDLGLKIACGLGAGMGRKQEVCGAVTGGIMVIGLRYGRGENDDRKVTDLAYAKVRELMDRFAEKHGTFSCRKLLNECELTTGEGQRQFKEKDLLHKVCAPCVVSVAEILEDMLEADRIL